MVGGQVRKGFAMMRDRVLKVVAFHAFEEMGSTQPGAPTIERFVVSEDQFTSEDQLTPA